MILNDVVKQFASICIFHDEIELFRRLNNFIKLDDVGMSDHFQDVDFTSNSFYVVYILYFVFL